MTQRRGFTLIEVLLALVIMGLVTGAIYRLLHTNQRLSLAQAEQVSLQSSVRTGSLIVPNELRELNTVLGSLNAAQNDVTDADPDGITYRAMRGLGFLCQASAANELRIYSAPEHWTGARLPDFARDSLYLFVDGDVDDDGDDQWVQADITGVNPASTCGGVPAIALTVDAAPVGIPTNAPVRIYELMRLQLDQDPAGEWWLAAQSVTADPDLQPVLGPLTSDGFQLQYLNSAGTPAATLDAITSIRVTVRGLTDDAVRVHGTGALGHPEEGLATQVLLRNSIRP